MSDDDKKDDKEIKRPNAKYKLSHEKIQEPEIVYHYNRERRLEKAPQSVRDLYKVKPRRRPGFLNSFIDTKPKTMLFGTIIVICLMIFVLSKFGMTGDSRELDGNIISIQAKKYNGTVIIEVKKTPGKDKNSVNAYTGAVNIAVFPPAKTGIEQDQQPTDIFYHRIFFTNEQEEHYSFTVPFDQSELSLIFQTEKKTVNLTIKPGNN
jgi:hypothetical protein